MSEEPVRPIDKAKNSSDIQPVASQEKEHPRHPNRFAEERYQLAVWLVRIGRQHKLGIFQQPDFVSKIFGRYMPHPKLLRRTDADMKGAVREWCADPVAAEIEYGHNSDWDTSSVTDIRCMFCGPEDYEEHYGPI